MAERRTNASMLVLVATIVVAAATATARQTPTPLAREQAILRAFDRGEPQRAASLIEDYLRQFPGHPQMLYNLACARSLSGELDAATGALYRAVHAGFRDFEHMRIDPDLDAIRGEKMYLAILEAAKKAAGERAEDALARWKRTYGEERYRYEIDEARRLAFATALDEVSHAEMRTMLQRESDLLSAMLFDAPPSYFVLIAVPTPEDADRVFGGDAAIGGRYEHANRRLVSRDIGGSLRHEFVHAMHYGHMERLGLRTAHPLWIQEGMAALFEDYEVSAGGKITFLPNERTNIVVRRARLGRLVKWKDFFELSAERFMSKAGSMYPQARSIFEFLADQEKLSAWYRAYVGHYDEDTTGARAFEIVFGQPVDEVEKRWRDWVRRRPVIDNSITYGDASLGIESELNASNDGILITGIMPGSAARAARLRVGDVIVAVDGEPTRSLLELTKLIGAKNVGDRIEVRARRRSRYFTTEVVLRPLGVPGR